MKAEILAIGTEVTTGSIVNTHSQYISNQLFDYGINVNYHTSVDDNIDRIKEVFNIALNRADLIITTGGLGPTQDDITKNIIADSLNLPLELNKEVEEIIRNRFKDFKRPMTDNNLQQAYIPKGGKYLFNKLGTAPGIYLKYNDKTVIMLPGPKNEMTTMFNNEVLPLLPKTYNLIKKSINLIGIGESQLESQLQDLINLDENINIATFSRENDLEIKIIGRGYNKDEIEEKIDYFVGEINKRFKENIFGYNNTSIEEVVFKLLRDKDLKIGFCESCTGGLISSRLSRIPGASAVFDRSIITYSNRAKENEVNVSKETLEKYGAVSKETAMEMAKGLFNKGGLDISLSITGIAGPDGGSASKPLGLVYMSIYDGEKAIVIEDIFTGGRETIQNRSASRAFWELRKYLLNIH